MPKCPNKSKGGRFVLAHCLRVQCIVVGKPKGHELGTAGYIVSKFRKQRWMNDSLGSALFPLFIQDSSTGNGTTHRG